MWKEVGLGLQVVAIHIESQEQGRWLGTTRRQRTHKLENVHKRTRDIQLPHAMVEPLTMQIWHDVLELLHERYSRALVEDVLAATGILC